MALLDRLERKFGRFGIPGLLRIVAGLQALVFVLYLVLPEDRKQDFLELLLLDPQKVLRGEIWRLVTFCVVPRSFHVLWTIFIVLILIWIGDLLEQAWGSFRLTLYYFSSVALLAIVALLGYPSYFYASSLLYENVFLAFAFMFPLMTINLYGILPVQARWLGLLAGGMLCYQFITLPPLRIPILASQLNFLVFVAPTVWNNLRRRSSTRARRTEFHARQLPDDGHFSRCHACGRTDATHPELDFRVAADGEEYCAEHLPK
ncbi:MAG: hypothetical protein KA004_09055 [Verrucomicrobiales bacterium]|nr:hypothetical protein [Verrucomicrobiales bacterium]